jgi:hypothetical protein
MADTPEVTPLATAPNVDPPKRMSAFGLLTASFGIYILAFLLTDLIEDSFLNGVADGLASSLEKAIFEVMMFGIVWGITILPLNFLTLAFYPKQRWHKYRTYCVLAPSICIFGFFMVGQVIDWPTARRDFAREAGVPLPTSAQDFRSFGMHNVKGDISDTFYFRCDPHDTEKLIQSMHLDEDKTGFGNSPIERPKPDWPDPGTWTGRRVYTYSDEKNWVFYNLVTDENQSQVYVSIME